MFPAMEPAMDLLLLQRAGEQLLITERALSQVLLAELILILLPMLTDARLLQRPPYRNPQLLWPPLVQLLMFPAATAAMAPFLYQQAAELLLILIYGATE